MSDEVEVHSDRVGFVLFSYKLDESIRELTYLEHNYQSVGDSEWVPAIVKMLEVMSSLKLAMMLKPDGLANKYIGQLRKGVEDLDIATLTVLCLRLEEEYNNHMKQEAANPFTKVFNDALELVKKNRQNPSAN